MRLADVRPYPNEALDLERAIQLATRAHAGQSRKGSRPIPYLSHPMGVAGIVASRTDVWDRDLIIAAILHDAVEDSTLEIEDVLTIWGWDVAILVDGVTRRKGWRWPRDESTEEFAVRARRNGERTVKLKDADLDHNEHSDNRIDTVDLTRMLTKWAKCRSILHEVGSPDEVQHSTSPD